MTHSQSIILNGLVFYLGLRPWVCFESSSPLSFVPNPTLLAINMHTLGTQVCFFFLVVDSIQFENVPRLEKKIEYLLVGYCCFSFKVSIESKRLCYGIFVMVYLVLNMVYLLWYSHIFVSTVLCSGPFLVAQDTLSASLPPDSSPFCFQASCILVSSFLPPLESFSLFSWSPLQFQCIYAHTRACSHTCCMHINNFKFRSCV